MVIAVPAVPPNVTAVVEVKPVPVIVTTVAPSVVPLVTLREVTAGAALAADGFRTVNRAVIRSDDNASATMRRASRHFLFNPESDRAFAYRKWGVFGLWTSLLFGQANR